MIDRDFLFLAGIHRSGTSLLHEIIREHPEISGMTDTGVPEDEGQHLQSVYPSDQQFGGPGRFALNKRAYMNEQHNSATDDNAEKLYAEWSTFHDLSRRYLVEKSPPNLIRTRYFQRLFPQARFIVILRHPVPVAYATKKWSRFWIRYLIAHTLGAYEIFFRDLPFLHSVHVVRYEEFVANPVATMSDIWRFLDLKPIALTHTVRSDVNERYFKQWEEDRSNLLKRNLACRVTPGLEEKAKRLGYSLAEHRALLPLNWRPPHQRLDSVQR